MKVGFVKREATPREAQFALLTQIENLERQALTLGMHTAAAALGRARNVLGWEMAGDKENALASANREVR